jgi:hypothetical protein
MRTESVRCSRQSGIFVRFSIHPTFREEGEPMQRPAASGGPLSGVQEKEAHLRAIERLARELDMPVQDVQQSYTEILEALKKNATIKAFLPVLVSRGVKERLRHR